MDKVQQLQQDVAILRQLIDTCIARGGIFVNTAGVVQVVDSLDRLTAEALKQAKNE